MSRSIKFVAALVLSAVATPAFAVSGSLWNFDFESIEVTNNTFAVQAPDCNVLSIWLVGVPAVQIMDRMDAHEVCEGLYDFESIAYGEVSAWYDGQSCQVSQPMWFTCL